jgi:hypothetical protein
VGWTSLLLFAFGLHLVLTALPGAVKPRRGGGLFGRRARVRRGLLVLVAAWGLAFPHFFWYGPTNWTTWIGLLLFAFGLHLVLIALPGAVKPRRGGGLFGRRARVRQGLLVLVAGWWLAVFAPAVMLPSFMTPLMMQWSVMACGCLTGFVLCLMLRPAAATGPSVVKPDRGSLAETTLLVCSGLLVLGVGLGLFSLVPVPQRAFGVFCGSLMGFGVCLMLAIDPLDAEPVEPLPLLKRVWGQATEEERAEFLDWVKGADDERTSTL